MGKLDCRSSWHPSVGLVYCLFFYYGVYKNKDVDVYKSLSTMHSFCTYSKYCSVSRYGNARSRCVKPSYKSRS